MYECECTSQYFYTVCIPVGFHAHTGLQLRDGQMCLYSCLSACVTRDFAQFFLSVFFFFNFNFHDCWAHRYTLAKRSHNSGLVTSCQLGPFPDSHRIWPRGGHGINTSKEMNPLSKMHCFFCECVCVCLRLQTGVLLMLRYWQPCVCHRAPTPQSECVNVERRKQELRWHQYLLSEHMGRYHGSLPFIFLVNF